MAHFPQTNTFVRAPRVTLRRAVSIDFVLSEQAIVRGELAVVSTTGGRARTSKQLSPGGLAEIRIGANHGIIRGIAEVLPGYQTIHGWLQPFRFVAIDDPDYDSLKQVISAA